MRMSSRFPFLAIALGAALLSGCTGDPGGAPVGEGQSAPYLVAVNNPLEYFARRLVGERVVVRMPADPEGDPAGWRPAVEDVLVLQGAELVLLNGAGYSGWLDRVSLDARRLVVTSEGARERWIPLTDHAPTTSVDEYFAELALWFGVPVSELDQVLPNVRSFYSPESATPPIGFLT